MRTAVVRLAKQAGRGTVVALALGMGPAWSEVAHRPGAPVASRLPLGFEARTVATGQVFVARSRDAAVVVRPGGTSLVLAGSSSSQGDAVVELRFAGGRATTVMAERPVTATAHYLVGEPREWRHMVPLYERVRVPQVWPGIDVVFHGRGRNVEYDLVLAPGADPSAVRIRIGGADRVEVDADGDVLVQTRAGVLRQQAPHAYQLDDSGMPVAVASAFAIGEAGHLRLDLGAYDSTRPVTVDPVLAYATDQGGIGRAFPADGVIAGVAVGSRGDVFVTGDATDVTFGHDGAVDLRAEGTDRDVFVARFSAEGSALRSVTYLGGRGRDDRASLVRSRDGTLVLAGRTESNNLAVTAGAVRMTLGGHRDAFVARLDASAERLVYLSYLGGSGDDAANAIADTTGDDILVVGSSDSADFPRVGSPGAPSAGPDAFVVRLSARETGGLSLATVFGGSAADVATGVTQTTSGVIVIAGQTRSDDLPLAAPLQTQRRGGADAFLAGFDASGARLFSTYFGGSAGGTLESATGISLATSAAFVVVGVTDAADLETTSAVQPSFGGIRDGFAARFVWNGIALVKAYATYLGGRGADVAMAVVVDASGAAMIVGGTGSADFPPGIRSCDDRLEGLQDAFLVRLSAAGQTLGDTSCYGGAGDDLALAIALDGLGDAFIVGQTGSLDLLPQSSGGGTSFDAVANGAEDAFVLRVALDADGDGLPDAWEQSWGLDPNDAAGDEGGLGDADRDWLSNLEEFRGGTSPLEAERFFAEGATGTAAGFDTRFAILNPYEDLTFDVLLEFKLDDGRRLTHLVDSVRPGQRVTVDAGALPGLPELAEAQFATVVRAPFGVVADRTMTWDARGYGSHAETATLQPSTTWYLAEGATHSGFDLFYLLQNPQAEAALVRVTWLRSSELAPLVKTYTVAPHSRFNIWVNQERFPDESGTLLLASAEVSAVIEVLNGVPVIVERSMYRSRPGRPPFEAGHESHGIPRASTRWFLAEGATTAGFFDLFVLIANPGDAAADVRVTYLLPDGTRIVRRYGEGGDHAAVAARSRTTVWVDLEDPRLADTAVSTIVESTNDVPIVVERTMWWPGPTPDAWTEAHNSAGAVASGTQWALAEGELGGESGWDTYVLVANTSSEPGRARLTLHYEDGAKDTVVVDLGASSRLTVAIGSLGFARAANARFGIVVQALPAVAGSAVPQIVVERAMYATGIERTPTGEYPAGWPFWPSGTNAVATRLR